VNLLDKNDYPLVEAAEELHCDNLLVTPTPNRILDKKHTILSNTVNLLDKNDYLYSHNMMRNEKYNPQSKG